MEFRHNTFRANDAFEYTDAYRWGVSHGAAEIRSRLAELSARMDRIAAEQDLPNYLLAAYRGYEDSLAFVERHVLPGVVKVDDRDPTRCEVMTPAGLAFA